MTESAGRIIADSIPAIIAAVVVSSASGVLGMYVGYRLVEQRVTRVESDVKDLGIRLDDDIHVINERLTKHDESLGVIRANTEYIRGRLESNQ